MSTDSEEWIEFSQAPGVGVGAGRNMDGDLVVRFFLANSGPHIIGFHRNVHYRITTLAGAQDQLRSLASAINAEAERIGVHGLRIINEPVAWVSKEDRERIAEWECIKAACGGDLEHWEDEFDKLRKSENE